MFSMAVYGMEGDDLLREGRDWYLTGDQKLSDDEWVPCRSARDFSDEPCLQKLFEHWTPKAKKLDEKKERNKRKMKKARRKKKLERSREMDFLEKEAAEQRRLAEEREAVKRRLKTDAKYAENILNTFRVMYQKRAEKSQTGLFHKEETYEGVSFHLIYDSCAWYLFNSQHKKPNPSMRLMLVSLQERALKEQLPGLSPVYSKQGFIYLFAGVKPNSQIAFGDFMTVITREGRGLTRDFRILEQLKLKREYLDSSIEPKMRDGTRDKKEAIHEKCLAQLGKLQRKAVSGGQRNGDYKP